jgi:ACS family glucarate transporter-like MFS transporter
VPWRRLIPRVAPLMIVYFCQGWTGWLFVTWMPSSLQKNYSVEIKKSAFLYTALLFSGFLAELIGGMTTDSLLRRTGSLQIARSLMIAGSWVFAWRGWCR